jgi:hypothetical protein
LAAAEQLGQPVPLQEASRLKWLYLHIWEGHTPVEEIALKYLGSRLARDMRRHAAPLTTWPLNADTTTCVSTSRFSVQYDREGATRSFAQGMRARRISPERSGCSGSSGCVKYQRRGLDRHQLFWIDGRGEEATKCRHDRLPPLTTKQCLQRGPLARMRQHPHELRSHIRSEPPIQGREWVESGACGLDVDSERRWRSQDEPGDTLGMSKSKHQRCARAHRGAVQTHPLDAEHIEQAEQVVG